MAKRLTHIVHQVTECHEILKDFDINPQDIKRMFNDVDNAIIGWQGVDITSCKKAKTNFKAYKTTATNWFVLYSLLIFIILLFYIQYIINDDRFNRNKAKIYGNYFFSPLIFKYILNV